MVETGRVLFTFEKDMESTARELSRHIVQYLEYVIVDEDHPFIADDSKIASREKIERRQNSNHQYMESVLSEWFNFESDEDKSVSIISSTEVSQSSATNVILEIE